MCQEGDISAEQRVCIRCTTGTLECMTEQKPWWRDPSAAPSDEWAKRWMLPIAVLVALVAAVIAALAGHWTAAIVFAVGMPLALWVLGQRRT